MTNTYREKISVITINLNNAEGLRRTLDSVFRQTTHDFELVVVDGASTDGSVELIHTHADRIDRWVSEPDGGIYNAMNKAVAMATGEYVIFMNSGGGLFSLHHHAYAFPSGCFHSPPTIVRSTLQRGKQNRVGLGMVLSRIVFLRRNLRTPQFMCGHF